MNKNYQSIPTNLITGFLGSGKTTLILNLLKSKPQNSKWAVLVNEFGDVGIDGSLLKHEGIAEGTFIKEVPGGCICCAAGLPLQMALNLLIKQAKPERILIEPTGVGHPRKVLETLTGEFYKDVLDLKATLCLVEPKKLSDKQYFDNETFQDQLNISDVLLASKADLAKSKDLQQFRQFSESFTIKKDYIEAIEHGQIDISILDIKRNCERSVAFPDAHKNKTHKHNQDSSENIIDNSMGSDSCDWRRFENNGQDYFGCGWIFNPLIVFDEKKLEKFIKDERFTRVKGIFQTSEGWYVFNRSEDSYSKEKSIYTDDSRVEIIEPEYKDWNLVENKLTDCIERYLAND